MKVDPRVPLILLSLCVVGRAYAAVTPVVKTSHGNNGSRTPTTTTIDYSSATWAGQVDHIRIRKVCTVERCDSASGKKRLVKDVGKAVTIPGVGLWQVDIFINKTIFSLTGFDYIVWSQYVANMPVATEPIKTAANRYQPILSFHPDEEYFPISIDDLSKQTISNTDIQQFSGKPDALSKEKTTVGELMVASPSRNNRFRIKGGVAEKLHGTEKDYPLYWISQLSKDGETLYITYFVLYGYDLKRAKYILGDGGVHALDREGISIEFTKTNADKSAWTPVSVIYAGHLSNQKTTFLGCANSKKCGQGGGDGLVSWNGGRTKVPWELAAKKGPNAVAYVADGSHAMYPAYGFYKLERFSLDIINGEPAGSIALNDAKKGALRRLDLSKPEMAPLIYSGEMINDEVVKVAINNWYRTFPYIRQPAEKWADGASESFSDCLTQSDGCKSYVSVDESGMTDESGAGTVSDGSDQSSDGGGDEESGKREDDSGAEGPDKGGSSVNGSGNAGSEAGGEGTGDSGAPDSTSGLGQWTLLRQESSIFGVYGTLGGAEPSNFPGARKNALTWTDSTGRLWLYGGRGEPSGTSPSYGGPHRLEDLWRFDPSSGFWTWMGGSKKEVDMSLGGTYGTVGQPSEENYPGPRPGANTWTDASGRLWLFAGDAEGPLGDGPGNDVWRYDPSTGLWTWVGGVKPSVYGPYGVYGALGEAAADNTPGGRRDAASWVDLSGNVWIFGGSGFGSAKRPNSLIPGLLNAKLLNDFWRYDMKSGLWTWIGGSTMVEASGVYGTAGQPSSKNFPGARRNSVSWVDTSGRLWLFGGYGFGSNGQKGELADLWRYDPATGLWAWIGGSKTSVYTGGIKTDVTGAPGAYGQLGEPRASNWPGARSGAAAWADDSRRFWLFGGNGFDANGELGKLNDLWRYDPSTSEWTWVGGSKTTGGSQLSGNSSKPGMAKIPCARSNAAVWADETGQIWLFGGKYNCGEYNREGVNNDLWLFEP